MWSVLMRPLPSSTSMSEPPPTACGGLVLSGPAAHYGPRPLRLSALPAHRHGR